MVYISFKAPLFKKYQKACIEEHWLSHKVFLEGWFVVWILRNSYNLHGTKNYERMDCFRWLDGYVESFFNNISLNSDLRLFNLFGGYNLWKTSGILLMKKKNSICYF